MVYVISKDGQPLMPTTRYGKVRRLLKSKQAKVINRCPFTIKLLYETTDLVQETNLGVDTGSKHVGFAVYSNGKILYQSQLELRDNINSKMDDRRGHRRFRRQRKTRYRKARLLNRKHSTHLNRLPPLIKSKVNSHIKEIEYIKSIIPVTNLILEVAQFDTHLLKNPMLVNEKIKHWGYQKGMLYGFANVKAYVLTRDKYTCQHCKTKNGTLHIHHIIYRSNGGSDEEINLITLCESCHKKLHKGELACFESKLVGKRKPNLRYATQMSIVRSQLLKHYTSAIETYGYITKENRQNLGLPKDHYIDACVIASQGYKFKSNNEIFYKKAVGRGSRILAKFRKVPIQLHRGKICGFRQYDKVKYLGKIYFIKGRRSAGTCALMDIFNNPVYFNHMSRGCKIPKLINCKRVSSRKSVIIEGRIGAIPVLS